MPRFERRHAVGSKPPDQDLTQLHPWKYNSHLMTLLTSLPRPQLSEVLPHWQEPAEVAYCPAASEVASDCTRCSVGDEAEERSDDSGEG